MCASGCLFSRETSKRVRKKQELINHKKRKKNDEIKETVNTMKNSALTTHTSTLKREKKRKDDNFLFQLFSSSRTDTRQLKV